MMTLRIDHPVPEPTTIPCMYGGARRGDGGALRRQLARTLAA